MGIFSPDFKIVGNFLIKMTEQLEDSTGQDTGCKFGTTTKVCLELC